MMFGKRKRLGMIPCDILQKALVADLFDNRQQIKNEGQPPKYYVHDCHPAIIDRGTFQRVQEEMA